VVQNKVCDFCKDITKTHRLRLNNSNGSIIIGYDICSKCISLIKNYCKRKHV
jgi:hypothetical protein